MQKRCEHATIHALQYLRQGVNQAPLFHDKVTCWLFGTGIMAHILPVAGLKNLTVRRRYMAVRELLADNGRLEFHESLLQMAGCAQLSRERIEHHLAAVADVFDVAKAIIRTPNRFAADISDDGRPVAIDGSRELIERGFHREAVLWIVATFCRCLSILHNDAPPETQRKFEPSFRELIGDLGVTSFADLQRLSEQVQERIPRVWEVAEAIMAANPDIED